MTVPAALLEGEPWSPPEAVVPGLGIGLAMMALGYGLWTQAMSHPTGVRLAPAAYASPLLSTGLLVATGQHLAPVGLIGCGLIILCAVGVGLDAIPRHRRDAARTTSPRRAHARRRSTLAGPCRSRTTPVRPPDP